MMRHACVPDMRGAEFAYSAQRCVGEVGKLAYTVFLNRPPGVIGFLRVAKQACKCLVNNRLQGGWPLVNLEQGRAVVPVDGCCKRALFQLAPDLPAVETN